MPDRNKQSRDEQRRRLDPAERAVIYLRAIHEDVHELRRIGVVIVQLLRAQQPEIVMTPEERAEVAAEAAALKQRWTQQAGSLDDELDAIKKTGVEPTT